MQCMLDSTPIIMTVAHAWTWQERSHYSQVHLGDDSVRFEAAYSLDLS